MDRVDMNGVICLITNNSFINNKAFDGFRKIVQDEFDYVYIIDLGGNIRELSGKDGIWLNEENTIFGVAAAVGIAIMFLVKKEAKDKVPCLINYIHPCDIRATRIEKLEYLHLNSFQEINFQRVIPDKKYNWINQTDNDFENLVSLVDKDVKSGKGEKAVFKIFSLGVASHRDEWVYDFESASLEAKMHFFSDIYMQTLINDKFLDKRRIAWDRELEKYRKRGIEKKVEKNKILPALFRPFVTKYHYFDRHFNGMFYQWSGLYSNVQKNKIISVNKEGNSKDLFCLATDKIVDLHTTGDSQCLPLYYFTSTGERIDNITNWGLQQFTDYYKNENITKIDLYHYTYAVLHNPAYRKKYELNLKREFPRIPFYDDFFQWRNWGKQLMDLHINYEIVQPYDLTQNNYKTKTETKKQKEFFAKVEEPEVLYARQPKIKVKLKADKAAGIIEIDELTLLRGVPKEAWEYKLGNRSALEWILDQYKEKKPTDPTIAKKFNTYRFADYKEKVIDLLKRVCTVSVETMKIVREMDMINKQQ